MTRANAQMLRKCHRQQKAILLGAVHFDKGFYCLVIAWNERRNKGLLPAVAEKGHSVVKQP
jgi:hypothetical protein